MKRSIGRRVVGVGLLTAAAAVGAQQRPENRLDLLPNKASSAPTITPVFSQLLMFSLPKDFKAAFDTTKDGRYIQQSLPIGQTLNHWTEMITVTGEQDAAMRPGVTARNLAEGIASFFRQTCPESFSTASFGTLKVDRYDGFATVIACGSVDAADPQSQQMLLVTIKGDRDLYTLQWAELGPPSKSALSVDPSKWQDRLARIAPVRLCAVVAGEAAPYPSCTGR